MSVAGIVLPFLMSNTACPALSVSCGPYASRRMARLPDLFRTSLFNLILKRSGPVQSEWILAHSREASFTFMTDRNNASGARIKLVVWGSTAFGWFAGFYVLSFSGPAAGLVFWLADEIFLSFRVRGRKGERVILASLQLFFGCKQGVSMRWLL